MSYFANPYAPNQPVQKCFRYPDYVNRPLGFYAWWGPARKREDAEAITTVSKVFGGWSVSEYTYLAGYEGFKTGEWRRIATFVDQRETCDPACAAKIGADRISDRGGDEEVVDAADLPV